MSGVTAGTALALGAVGGLALSTMMAQSPNLPAPMKPESPPQASQAPNVQGIKSGQAGTGQSGGAPGVAQTFLTGSTGIDPSQLQLDKNTLLGGKSLLGA